MDSFLPPTSLLQSQDQNGNPNSSSSSLNHPYSVDDQIYHFDFDDNILYYNHNPNLNPNPDLNPYLFVDPPSYQDSNSSSFAPYFSTNEQSPVLLEMATTTNTAESSYIYVNDTSMAQTNDFRRNFNREMVHDGMKISFRVKTKLEVLDDGYKWRKYGKKKVKTSHNPRNYYKCSTIGCHVKKRVERDRDDSDYVIATYIGMHNHEIPSSIPSNTRPPQILTLQLSSESHTSICE